MSGQFSTLITSTDTYNTLDKSTQSIPPSVNKTFLVCMLLLLSLPPGDVTKIFSKLEISHPKMMLPHQKRWSLFSFSSPRMGSA